jgi:hypothetical protein
LVSPSVARYQAERSACWSEADDSRSLSRLRAIAGAHERVAPPIIMRSRSPAGSDFSRVIRTVRLFP